MVLLNLINRSNDLNNSTIVIFQAPPQEMQVSGSGDYSLYAWKVISNLRPGESFTFKYSPEIFASACDSWGNFAPLMPAARGSSFVMQLTSDGEELTPAGKADDPEAVVIRNGMKDDTIDAYIYKDGRPLACKKNLSPAESVSFRFRPEIGIAVMPSAHEGQPLTEIPKGALLFIGDTITRADIVMTGGGQGAPLFEFELVKPVNA